MKKLIVHIGLPKTATTTLQKHLFQKLHDDGKINFLGRVLDVDEKTKKLIPVNYRGEIIRKACEGKLSADVKLEVDTLLRDDMLNVYSDEALLAYFPGNENLSIEQRISNLEFILDGYEVKILLSLRNPWEYFYSFYIQLYPGGFSTYEELDSFNKYYDYYLKNNNHLMFESFNYSKLLNNIFSKFDTKVILFEDLKNDPNCYYKDLSELLGISSSYIKQSLSLKSENVTTKTKKGNSSEVQKSILITNIKQLFAKESFMYKMLKSVYDFKLLNLRTLFGKTYTYVEVIHEKPTVDQIKNLNKTLLLKSDFEIKKYNLDIDKLKKYGYMKND